VHIERALEQRVLKRDSEWERSLQEVRWSEVAAEGPAVHDGDRVLLGPASELLDECGGVLRAVDEEHTVVLSNPVGVTIQRAVGTANVGNDDEATLVSVSNFTIPEGDYGDRVLNAPVVLSAPSQFPVTVAWAVTHGNTDFADVSPTSGRQRATKWNQ